MKRWLTACGTACVAAFAFGAGPKIQSLQVTPTATLPPTTGAGYVVSNYANGSSSEIRLLLHGHHFATVLTNSGIVAIRPHPGVDRNGWGSTLYLQPFIGGAVLGHSTVQVTAVSSTGISFRTGGFISRGSNSTYGTWSMTNLFLQYNPAQKEMTGSGIYAMTLAGPIAAAGNDLNLCKLASNFLDDVPLLDGTTGDTGDMTQADYTTDFISTNWVPPLQPSHFPGPRTEHLSITAQGDFYDVDTVAQSETNFRAIQAAYKPSLRIDFTALGVDNGMVPGFIYQTSQSRLYFADNVGITPVVQPVSTATQFLYRVDIRSSALPGDGTGSDADMVAGMATPTNWPSIEIYVEEDLRACRTNRFVGLLWPAGPTNYQATFEIPRLPATAGDRSFLRLVAPYHRRLP